MAPVFFEKTLTQRNLSIDVYTWQPMVVHMQHYRKACMFYNSWCKLEVQKLWGHVKINSKALRRDKVGCFMTALFFLNMLSGVIRGILECGILFSYLLSHQKKVSHNTLLIKCLVVPLCYQLIPPWSNKVIWKKPNVKSIFAINRCSNSLSPS